MKKKPNVDLEQLKRNKYLSAESKFEWLQSALEFAQASKKIIKSKNST